MIIFVKNKYTLELNEFKFRCCIGKNGSTKNKLEGDNKTPKGLFKLGRLFYRKDRIHKPKTNLKCSDIKRNFRWCDDPNDKKNYNKLITKKSFIKSENLFRKDYKYDLLLVIKYNTVKRVPGKGSAIFIHLTKKYQPTAGCIALCKKDFLILLKIINKKTRIKIY